MSLQGPRLPSRVKGSQAVLKRLRAVLIANARTLTGRELDEDTQRWHGRIHELVGRLIDEGDQVLPAFRDPREWRRAKKRPDRLF
jgi:hypothetical protein